VALLWLGSVGAFLPPQLGGIRQLVGTIQVRSVSDTGSGQGGIRKDIHIATAPAWALFRSPSPKAVHLSHVCSSELPPPSESNS
jgi:hypothetical protein